VISLVFKNKSWKEKKTVGKELKKRKRQGGKFID
jgi:hypothetical protein